MDGAAPYRQVLTHGFTVDAHGRKMSKSLGNVRRAAESHRLAGRRRAAPVGGLRPTTATRCRCPTRSSSAPPMPTAASATPRASCSATCTASIRPCIWLPVDDMLAARPWVVHRAHELQQRDRRSLRALRLRRDRAGAAELLQQRPGRAVPRRDQGPPVHDAGRQSRGRRSAQSAMYRIIEAFARWIAPILSFTADEIWQHLPGERDEQRAVRDLAYRRAGAAADGDVSTGRRTASSRLLALREAVARCWSRCAPTARSAPRWRPKWMRCAPTSTSRRWLRTGWPTNCASCSSPRGRPAAAGIAAGRGDQAEGSRCVDRRTATGQRSACAAGTTAPTSGSIADHPELCGRCVENVDGAGEARKWF